jgi:hypothetical protein
MSSTKFIDFFIKEIVPDLRKVVNDYIDDQKGVEGPVMDYIISQRHKAEIVKMKKEYDDKLFTILDEG